MSVRAITMEQHFTPGFKYTPLLFVGSQTHPLWSDIPKEQAQEGFYLAGIHSNHIGIVRDIDPYYTQYWNLLMEGTNIINLFGLDKTQYLSDAILKNQWAIKTIAQKIPRHIKLLPFLTTSLEQKLAKKLGISIHGIKQINDAYGTKSGIRKLAKEIGIPTPPGYICKSMGDIKYAIKQLNQSFEYIVIKHDTSVSGYLSKKLRIQTIQNIEKIIESLLGRTIHEGKDILIVEGWVKNTAVIGAHIEILKGKKPYICASWQQLIDADGVSYIGAGPLTISQAALVSLKTQLKKLGSALAKKGATGSFGPDFLITSTEEKILTPDSAVLIELNARTPYTAFPLEAIKHIKGNIGSSFYIAAIHTKKKITFSDIARRLSEKKLLITKRSPHATGIIPFNVGMLPWNSFNYIALADTWIQTQKIAQEMRALFQ